MLVNCIKCHMEYKAFPSEIKAGFAKYCSRKCFNIGRLISINKECFTCKKEFMVYPSEIRKGRKYCSRKCYVNRNGKKTAIKCMICAKKIVSIPSRTRKYCSHACLRKAQKSKPSWNSNPIYRICLICKRKFRTILARAKDGNKYCSKECYLVEHTKNTWTTGICKGCHKEFRFMTHRKQTCCSLSCNMKWRIQLQDLDKREKRNCLQCTKKILVRACKIKEGRGKFCSRRCYSVWMSENRLGNKSFAWKGGITNLYKKIRALAKYRQWQQDICLRDKVCVLCTSPNQLETDHIKTFSSIIHQYKITTTAEAVRCVELWDIKNGRLLCHFCHKKTKSYGYNILNKKIIQNR